MFSGYLQAAIYSGMNGTAGLAGWRWLFIFCGIISIVCIKHLGPILSVAFLVNIQQWGPLWGFFAVPDNPYVTKARWMREDEQAKHMARMSAIDRRNPVPLTWTKVRKIFTRWPLYVFVFTLM